MANKSGLSFNFTNFNKGFTKIVMNTIPKLAEEGLFIAGARLIKDAIMQEPRAPHLTGHLWRNQLIKAIKDDRQIIGVSAGFNVPYAARLHEAPNNWAWTLKGSGPKFLESKLAVNKDNYMELAANHIRSKQK